VLLALSIRWLVAVAAERFGGRSRAFDSLRWVFLHHEQSNCYLTIGRECFGTRRGCRDQGVVDWSTRQGAVREDAAVSRRKDMRGRLHREVLAASAGGKPLKVEKPTGGTSMKQGWKDEGGMKRQEAEKA
jgi:hypothetical protein